MILKGMKTIFYITQQMLVLIFISLLTLVVTLGLFSIFMFMYFKELIGDKLKWI